MAIFNSYVSLPEGTRRRLNMAMIVFSCFFSINIDYFPVEHGLFPCHLCGTRVVQPHLDWKRKMVRSHMTGSLPSIQHNYGKSHENPWFIDTSWFFRSFPREPMDLARAPTMAPGPPGAWSGTGRITRRVALSPCSLGQAFGSLWSDAEQCSLDFHGFFWDVKCTLW